MNIVKAWRKIKEIYQDKDVYITIEKDKLIVKENGEKVLEVTF